MQAQPTHALFYSSWLTELSLNELSCQFQSIQRAPGQQVSWSSRTVLLNFARTCQFTSW
jgi:hypothetical protein